MTLRRLSLTLALLSAPAAADDLDDLTRVHPGYQAPDAFPAHRTVREQAALEDLLLRSDGSIAGFVGGGLDAHAFVPWSIVHLVLADLEDEGADADQPVWIRVPPVPRSATKRGWGSLPGEDATPLVALSELAGSPVAGPGGKTIGMLRGALVSLTTGRVPALAIDVGAYLGTESRTIAVPWSMLQIPSEAGAIVRLAGEALDWIHSAPHVDLAHSLDDAQLESGLHGERFSPRFEPNAEAQGILFPWLEWIRRG